MSCVLKMASPARDAAASCVRTLATASELLTRNMPPIFDDVVIIQDAKLLPPAWLSLADLRKLAEAGRLFWDVVEGFVSAGLIDRPDGDPFVESMIERLGYRAGQPGGRDAGM